MPAALLHLPPVCLRSTPVGAKRVVYTPFRSLLDKRSTFHFGRCWTRATGTQQHWRLATQARSAALYVLPTAVYAAAPVGAERVVYAPLRSLLDKRHRRLATLARSNRPYTLGLSNVHTQGQINLPLRLPT